MEVDPEVLFVQCLQAGVKKPTQKWALDLFYNFCARLLRVMLRDERT